MPQHMKAMMGTHMQKLLEQKVEDQAAVAATGQKVEDLENLIWKQNGFMRGMKDTMKKMEKDRLGLEAALQAMDGALHAIRHVFTWSTDKSWKEVTLHLQPRTLKPKPEELNLRPETGWAECRSHVRIRCVWQMLQLIPGT